MHNNYIYCVVNREKKKIEGQYLLYNPSLYKWMVLDEIGYEIVNYLKDNDIDNLKSYLKNKYQIDDSIFARDVLPFINVLKEKGYMEPKNEKEILAVDLDKKENYPFSEMYISLTNRCNLNCLYCFNKEKRHQKIAQKEFDINKNDYIKAIEEFKAIGGKGIVFTGGEPSLHSQIIEYAEIASEVGLTPKMITNITNLKNIDIGNLLKYIRNIEFSLDSNKDDILSVLWNDGRKKYINDICDVFNAVSKASEDGNRMKIVIAPVVNKVNADSIVEMIDFVDENLKNCEVTWNFTKYEKIDDLIIDKKLIISDEEYRETLSRIGRKLINKISGVKNRDAYIELFSITSGGKKMPQRNKKYISCSPSFFMGVDGDVYICQGFDENNDGYLGNIKDKSLMEMFENDKFQVVRERIRVDKAPGCDNCELRFACAYQCVAKERNEEKKERCKEETVYKMYLQSIIW